MWANSRITRDMVKEKLFMGSRFMRGSGRMAGRMEKARWYMQMERYFKEDGSKV